MEDVKDILNLPKKDNSKKEELFSREVLNLTGGAPPMKPSTSKKFLKGLKEKRLDKKPSEKWVWAPFTNSARSDGLFLYHWRKANDKEEDYAFSKFNKQIELVEFSEEEYNLVAEHGDWTKEETLYLWDLCKNYDLRFIVVQDRYDETKYKRRSVEDLKERYYTLASKVLELRGVKEHPIQNHPYNPNYERKRKAQLERYFLRTKEQDDEERQLCEEARKLDVRIKKEEKEMKNYEKLMNAESEEIELPEWTQGKKETPKGPFLRSYFLAQPQLPSRVQKKVETILKDVGIPEKPTPTQEVVDLFTKLKKEALILLHLQKHLIKKENEKKSLEEKIKELRHTRKPNMKVQTYMPPKQQLQPIRTPTKMTKQTIEAMNNLQSSALKRGMGKVRPLPSEDEYPDLNPSKKPKSK